MERAVLTHSVILRRSLLLLVAGACAQTTPAAQPARRPDPQATEGTARIERGHLAINPQDDEYRVRLPPELAATGRTYTAHVKLCVSTTGEVTTVRLLESVDPAIDDEIRETLKRWRYHPYRVDGRPIPFCTDFRYEIVATAGSVPEYRAPPGDVPADEPPPKFVPPNVAKRLLDIDPMHRAYRVRLPPALAVEGKSYWALVKLCVSSRGRVTTVKIVKEAHPALDADIVSSMSRWRYRPLVLEGKAVPFCTSLRYEIIAR